MDNCVETQFDRRDHHGSHLPCFPCPEECPPESTTVVNGEPFPFDMEKTGRNTLTIDHYSYQDEGDGHYNPIIPQDEERNILEEVDEPGWTKGGERSHPRLLSSQRPYNESLLTTIPQGGDPGNDTSLGDNGGGIPTETSTVTSTEDRKHPEKKV